MFVLTKSPRAWWKLYLGWQKIPERQAGRRSDDRFTIGVTMDAKLLGERIGVDIYHFGS